MLKLVNIIIAIASVICGATSESIKEAEKYDSSKTYPVKTFADKNSDHVILSKDAPMSPYHPIDADIYKCSSDVHYDVLWLPDKSDSFSAMLNDIGYFERYDLTTVDFKHNIRSATIISQGLDVDQCYRPLSNFIKGVSYPLLYYPSSTNSIIGSQEENILGPLMYGLKNLSWLHPVSDMKMNYIRVAVIITDEKPLVLGQYPALENALLSFPSDPNVCVPGTYPSLSQLKEVLTETKTVVVVLTHRENRAYWRRLLHAIGAVGYVTSWTEQNYIKDITSSLNKVFTIHCSKMLKYKLS